ncbi:aspartate--tRNA ligase [Buchnera aphidicola]|uniref:aspartate--tRNA ligase n=1 Tax=Buchnera aphidicola TaxID=9 RepID=UPI0031B84CFF
MRTHYCGKLNKNDINKIVKLYGWVQKYRNLGKIIFINMRDCTGNVQIFCNFKYLKNFKKIKKIKNEFCIKVIGIVQKKKKFKNEIEILTLKIKIINYSKPLPIDINNKNNKEIRFKYRYLDLRKKNILLKFKIRNKIKKFIRKFLEKNYFIEIETPILTKSTPEGAKDYIVPSRIHKKKYYALPQSPQIFKQLLMIAGIDRYYQIAKCFRDEDLRADRQPEFTQIDIETSFMNAKEIRNITEKMISKLWKKINNKKLKKFPIITYKNSMKLYGSDKPDLRNPLKLIEFNKILKKKIYKNFLQLNIKKKNRIVALYISKIHLFKKKYFNSYKKIVKKYSNKKLYLIKFNKKKFFNKKYIKKNIKKKIFKKIFKSFKKIKNNDKIIFFADKKKIVNKTFNIIRLKLGNDLKITQKKKWKPLWIINFPLFKKKNGKLTCTNHPFTAPKKKFIKNLKINPEKIISDSYDLIINGYEIGGGSVRINNNKIQKKIFNIIKMKKEIQKKTFGFFLEALKYGAPTHAGIALGLDRLTMLLTKSKSIREIIAFPKTTNAICPVSDAPTKYFK